MRVSVIIAVYKDSESLSLIIDALKRQTYKNFEVIVAEDGENSEMKAFVDSIEGLDVRHTTQEDIGVRKARSQNNGIIAGSGEYLIFIDGDCIPYTTFIEAHATLAQRRVVLSGRRVNLSEVLTRKIKNHELDVLDIEKRLYKYIGLAFEKNSKYEYGIYLSPRGWLYPLLSKLRKRNTSILGCNFSCFREDMIAINGFDEGYGETSLSDDTDLDWRFRACGLEIKSCKNVANQFHLWHPYNERDIGSFYWEKMVENQKENRFVCEKGLNDHR
ncbi:MAG: glycosyltransferase [Sulfuricurvum sp.]|jgi:glycosyltransferase involved in cell wall biosynthesis|uniref:glycosyltransferase n=1 Tax=Sulfuricurvum sp. TaxID=2025608 RepID=UPI0025F7D9ED|nr:glycosyltransferase [Sulfuricurvum sp.]MCK9373403.1 glycosyltransferase [Sulfuricurvum sp.]